MSTSRPELHPVPDAPALEPEAELRMEILEEILLELRALNATIAPLAEAAGKLMPFRFGFGNGRH